jgi:hypothetical protein
MPNLLPIETWRNIMGYHPYHFFQLANSAIPLDGCNDLVWSYPWMSADAASRQDVRNAIISAESILTRYLNFSPAPRYVEQTYPWPMLADGSQRWGAIGADWRWLTVQTDEGYVQAAGVEQLTLLGTPNLVYSDPDGDGLSDTWTLTLATTITDAAQFAVYYAAADRLNSAAAGDDWRILPVTITIAGGVVTIRGRSWQVVKPILYEGFASNTIDPNPAPLTTTFVSALDVYQRTTNANGITITTSQAVITWETRPSHGWWCCCDGCAAVSTAFSGSVYDPAAVAQAVARVGIRDKRHGLLTPSEASYDATTGIWSALDWTVCSQPDRVTLRYLAGYPLASDGIMAEPYRTVVARLAAAELGRVVCGCDYANRELYRWQFDTSQTARGDELFGISQENLNNPLGTRRGHVYAWKFIQDHQQLTGILA